MNRSRSHRDAGRGLSRICLSATLGTMLLSLPSVWAASEEKPSPRVLILADKPTDLFIERIKAEIVGLGLSVVTRAPAGPLEEDARAQHAIAAIRLLATRNGVEVWMADATSGRSLLRQIIIDERPDGPDQNLIALQTAELLRTSLFPYAQNPPTNASPPAGSAGPPAGSTVAASAPAGATSAEMAAQAGMGALLSPGGSGPELQVWLSVQRFFGRRFGLAADFSLPIVRATLDGPEGTAKIGTAMAGLAVLTRLQAVPSAWFLNAGLGTAVLRVGFDGEAAPTLISSSTSMFTGAVYGRLDGGYAPTDWLRLGVHVLGGATFDHVDFRFAGNDAGSWGRAFAGVALFAEADW